MTVHLCLVFHGQPPGALRNLKQIMKPVLILLKVEKQKGKGFHTKFCSPKGSRADKKVEHERHWIRQSIMLSPEPRPESLERLYRPRPILIWFLVESLGRGQEIRVKASADYRGPPRLLRPNRGRLAWKKNLGSFQSVEISASSRSWPRLWRLSRPPCRHWRT